jgi:hypothetical protein
MPKANIGLINISWDYGLKIIQVINMPNMERFIYGAVNKLPLGNAVARHRADYWLFP